MLAQLAPGLLALAGVYLLRAAISYGKMQPVSYTHLDRTAREQHSKAEKGKQAERDEQRAGLQKRAQRLLLAGNIREDHAACHAAVALAVFRDLADGVLRSLRRGGNHPQKRPVGQIVIS